MNVATSYEKAQHYAALPYTLMLFEDQNTADQKMFGAYYEEFPGCIGQGYSIAEARTDLHLALIDYIASMLDDGLPISLPTPRAETTSMTTNITSGASTFTLLSFRLPYPNRTTDVGSNPPSQTANHNLTRLIQTTG